MNCNIRNIVKAFAEPCVVCIETPNLEPDKIDVQYSCAFRCRKNNKVVLTSLLSKHRIDKNYVYICHERNIKVYNHELDFLFEFTNDARFIGYDFHIKDKIIYTWHGIEETDTITIFAGHNEFIIPSTKKIEYTLDCMLVKNNLKIDIYKLLPTKFKYICSLNIDNHNYVNLKTFPLTNIFSLCGKFYEIIL